MSQPREPGPATTPCVRCTGHGYRMLNWLIHRLHSAALASCKAALAPSLLSKSATKPPGMMAADGGQRFLNQSFLPFVHGSLSHDQHLNVRCEICSWASRHTVIARRSAPADTQRWVIRRKAEIVAAVQGGLLTCEEACDRYGLTAEEFRAWQASLHRYGLAGLKIKRLDYVRRRRAYGLG